jgi:hypothetical protein
MISLVLILDRINFDSINSSLNAMGFSLIREIKIGDFITASAILLSLVSLLTSLRKDRNLREREQADRVRNAAARTLARLDRWKEISLLIFAQMDIVFVETSKLWASGANGEALRDELWERLDQVRVKSLENITKEEIETAYQDLYSFDPYVRDYFENVLNLLKDEEEVMFRMALLPGVQNILDEMERINCDRQTATFRNPLMAHSIRIRGKYEVRLNTMLIIVSKHLLKLIGKKDKELLSINEHYFKNLEINIAPVIADDYGIITKKNTAFIRLILF